MPAVRIPPQPSEHAHARAALDRWAQLLGYRDLDARGASAALAAAVGVSPQRVSHLATGRRRLTDATADRWERAIQASTMPSPSAS